MRDILTALAGLVIVLLTAALVAPPLIDWDARRGQVEEALTRAVGAPIETAGDIDVRLLPSPRMTVGYLQVGGGPGTPRLVAEEVVAEIALAPLLRGEIRFTTGTAETAELRLPAGTDGAFRLPPIVAPDAPVTRSLAFDDLRAGTLAIVTDRERETPTTLLRLDAVRLSAGALLGPYRIEGAYGGLPFSLATGRVAPDGTAQVRFLAGEDTPTRLEADATLTLEETGDGFYTASLAGDARALLRPRPPGAASAPDADPPEALAMETGFETQAEGVALSPLVVETGEAASGTRLEGEGFLRLGASPLLSLDLSSRRVVAERVLEGPLGVVMNVARREAPPVPITLDLAIENLALGGEELAGVALSVSSRDGDTLAVEAARATLPGDTVVGFSGDIVLGDTPRIEGPAYVVSQDTARLGRFLSRLGAEGPLLGLLDGQPLDLSARLSWDADLLALSNLRLAAGDTALTGALRYEPGGIGVPALLDAQIAADGLDLANLPRLAALSDVPTGLDVTLVVDARDVRFAGTPGAGRIQARLNTLGDGLAVETLEITDLAGASASVAGRISDRGTGSIEGTLTAVEAEPLIALLGTVAFGDAVSVIPRFIREGALDVALTVERFTEGNATGEPGLRTTIVGTAAGGPIEAQWLTFDGRTERLEVTLSTDDTRTWIDVDHPLVAGRASLLSLTMGRSGPDRITARLAADVAGLRLDTTRPLVLDALDYTAFDGEVDLATSDLRPALALVGGDVVAENAVPAALRASFTREGVETLLQAGGTIAGETVRADITMGMDGTRDAHLRLGRLSLPWLVQTLALGDVLGETSGTWSREAFAAVSRPLEDGTATIETPELDLGRGLVARDARLDLALVRDGVSITGLEGALADGRIVADLTLRRPSAESAAVTGEASLADIDIAALSPDSMIRGRVTGTVEFGGVGQNLAETIGALSGEGRFTITDVVVPGADPSAIRRGLDLALREEDPLGGRRIETYVGGALEDAPFRAEALEAPATLVSGILTLSPIDLAATDARGTFDGVAAFDLRSLTLAVEGFLETEETPQGWEGPAPMIGISLDGPPADLARTIDTGPLTNGIAAIVLQRELARIEAFEREASERQRRLDEARLLDLRRTRAEEWRIEAERRRIEEDRARAAAEARAREADARSMEALAAERARQAEEEARRAAEEAARRAAEEEARRAAEEEARRAAEEEARRAAEEESRRAAEEEARRAAEEEARRAAEEEARRAAEAEADAQRRAAEEEARLRAEAEAEAEADAEAAARRAADDAAAAPEAQPELELPRLDSGALERLINSRATETPPARVE